MYVYRHPDWGLWQVGHYEPSGRWIADSSHSNKEDAAERVAYLNGDSDDRSLRERIIELEAAHDTRGLGALALAESRGRVIAALVDERIVLGRRIFELEQQLAAALATIERACGEEEPDGKLYAEGCAP